MATTSGTLSAAGTVALTLTSGPVPDNRAFVGISGTYGTAVARIQGTPDGTTWFNLAAVDVSSGTRSTGSLSPTDDSSTAWLVDVTGCSQVRFSLSSLASGTVSVAIVTTYSPVSPLQTPSNVAVSVGSTITLDDAANIVLGTTTGTKIGTATTQKIGLWNATPVVQPAGADQAAVTPSTDFTGADTVDKAVVLAAVQAVETLVNQLRSDLVTVGVIKGSA